MLCGVCNHLLKNPLPMSLFKVPFSLLPWLCCGIIAPFFSPWAPPLGWAWAMAAAGGAATLWVVLRLPERRVLAGLCVVVAGMGYGVARTQAQLALAVPAASEVQTQTLPFKVVGMTRADARAHRFEVQLQTPGLARLNVADYRKQDWPLGSVWEAPLRLRANVGEANPTGFNREAWALANHYSGSATVDTPKRRFLADEAGWTQKWEGLRQKVLARIQAAGADCPQGAAMVAALTVGERADLDAGAWQAFRRLGITHLLSISGLHISMTALGAGWLFLQFLRRTGRWGRYFRFRLPETPRTWALVVGVAVAWAYAFLAGFGVPVERSVMMVTVAAAAWWWRRAWGVGQIWWLALASVLLYDPAAVLAVGSWLSFGMVAVLLLAGAGTIALPDRKRLLWQAQAATAVGSIVPGGYAFGQVALVAPLANVIAIPWFSWLLTPAALLALLLPVEAPLRWVCALAQGTLNVLLWLGEMAPLLTLAHAPWPLLLAAVAATAVLLMPRGSGFKPAAVLVLAMFVLYRPPLPAPGQARVTVWDVGQGTAMSVQTREHSLLFDTGHPGAALTLLPNLYAQGMHHLDALVLSHHDNDHDGGLDEVRQNLPITQIWAGQPEAYRDLGLNAAHCRLGQHWEWDGVRFEFLNLPEPPSDSDNDHSCVLKVSAGTQAVLISGDLSVAGEADLAAHDSEALAATWLVLGHHGSKTSTSAEFLAAVAPRGAVSSAGFANSYHHPHPSVVARLQGAGVPLYRTDTGGAWQTVLGQNPPKFMPPVTRKPYWQRKPFDAVLSSEVPAQPDNEDAGAP